MTSFGDGDAQAAGGTWECYISIATASDDGKYHTDQPCPKLVDLMPWLATALQATAVPKLSRPGTNVFHIALQLHAGSTLKTPSATVREAGQTGLAQGMGVQMHSCGWPHR